MSDEGSRIPVRTRLAGAEAGKRGSSSSRGRRRKSAGHEEYKEIREREAEHEGDDGGRGYEDDSRAGNGPKSGGPNASMMAALTQAGAHRTPSAASRGTSSAGGSIATTGFAHPTGPGRPRRPHYNYDLALNSMQQRRHSTASTASSVVSAAACSGVQCGASYSSGTPIRAATNGSANGHGAYHNFPDFVSPYPIGTHQGVTGSPLLTGEQSSAAYGAGAGGAANYKTGAAGQQRVSFSASVAGSGLGGGPGGGGRPRPLMAGVAGPLDPYGTPPAGSGAAYYGAGGDGGGARGKSGSVKTVGQAPGMTRIRDTLEFDDAGVPLWVYRTLAFCKTVLGFHPDHWIRFAVVFVFHALTYLLLIAIGGIYLHEESRNVAENWKALAYFRPLGTATLYCCCQIADFVSMMCMFHTCKMENLWTLLAVQDDVYGLHEDRVLFEHSRIQRAAMSGALPPAVRAGRDLGVDQTDPPTVGDKVVSDGGGEGLRQRRTGTGTTSPGRGLTEGSHNSMHLPSAERRHEGGDSALDNRSHISTATTRKLPPVAREEVLTSASMGAKSWRSGTTRTTVGHPLYKSVGLHTKTDRVTLKTKFTFLKRQVALQVLHKNLREVPIFATFFTMTFTLPYWFFISDHSIQVHPLLPFVLFVMCPITALLHWTLHAITFDFFMVYTNALQEGFCERLKRETQQSDTLASSVHDLMDADAEFCPALATHAADSHDPDLGENSGFRFPSAASCSRGAVAAQGQDGHTGTDAAAEKSGSVAADEEDSSSNFEGSNHVSNNSNEETVSSREAQITISSRETSRETLVNSGREGSRRRDSSSKRKWSGSHSSRFRNALAFEGVDDRLTFELALLEHKEINAQRRYLGEMLLSHRSALFALWLVTSCGAAYDYWSNMPWSHWSQVLVLVAVLGFNFYSMRNVYKINEWPDELKVQVAEAFSVEEEEDEQHRELLQTTKRMFGGVTSSRLVLHNANREYSGAARGDASAKSSFSAQGGNGQPGVQTTNATTSPAAGAPATTSSHGEDKTLTCPDGQMLPATRPESVEDDVFTATERSVSHSQREGVHEQQDLGGSSGNRNRRGGENSASALARSGEFPSMMSFAPDRVSGDSMYDDSFLCEGSHEAPDPGSSHYPGALYPIPEEWADEVDDSVSQLLDHGDAKNFLERDADVSNTELDDSRVSSRADAVTPANDFQRHAEIDRDDSTIAIDHIVLEEDGRIASVVDPGGNVIIEMPPLLATQPREDLHDAAGSSREEELNLAGTDDSFYSLERHASIRSQGTSVDSVALFYSEGVHAAGPVAQDEQDVASEHSSSSSSSSSSYFHRPPAQSSYSAKAHHHHGGVRRVDEGQEHDMDITSEASLDAKRRLPKKKSSGVPGLSPPSRTLMKALDNATGGIASAVTGHARAKASASGAAEAHTRRGKRVNETEMEVSNDHLTATNPLYSPPPRLLGGFPQRSPDSGLPYVKGKHADGDGREKFHSTTSVGDGRGGTARLQVPSGDVGLGTNMNAGNSPGAPSGAPSPNSRRTPGSPCKSGASTLMRNQRLLLHPVLYNGGAGGLSAAATVAKNARNGLLLVGGAGGMDPNNNPSKNFHNGSNASNAAAVSSAASNFLNRERGGGGPGASLVAALSDAAAEGGIPQINLANVRTDTDFLDVCEFISKQQANVERYDVLQYYMKGGPGGGAPTPYPPSLRAAGRGSNTDSVERPNSTFHAAMAASRLGRKQYHG